MLFSCIAHHQSALRDTITSNYRRDEKSCVSTLLAQSTQHQAYVPEIQKQALGWIHALRKERAQGSGVDALMQEFALNSEEGVALMCLAEALLRIPDVATADKLIRDKIVRGNWKSHLGQSHSLFVNASSWGLLITGKLLSSYSDQGLAAATTRLIAKGGEPLIRKAVHVAMRLLGKQFVLGQTIEEALQNSKARGQKGYTFSYDMLGEAAMTDDDAQRYLHDYVQAIHIIGQDNQHKGVYKGSGISVKLSAIHPRYSRQQHQRVIEELLPRLKSLFCLAQEYNIGINIDAEEADRLELSLDLIDILAHDPDLAHFKGFGIVVQAYQKRCPYVIDYLINLAIKTRHRFMVRLVKGAYWDSEIKRAQMEGLPGYPVYTRKVYTDVAYLVCAQKLLQAQDAIYPQFATHNAYTASAIIAMAKGLDFEFQCLHGMGENLYDQITQLPEQYACRIYAPVGSHTTLLAYLVRRLLENGANSSFVHRIVDPNVPAEELVEDPFAKAIQYQGEPHPDIVLPEQLYGRQRRNSTGIDFSNEFALQTLEQGLQRSEAITWEACPILAHGDKQASPSMPIVNPANPKDTIGTVREAKLADIEQALTQAQAFKSEWQNTAVSERATYLRNAADLFEQQQANLIGLLVREAGKNLQNAIGEVREAIDFCRYYADQSLSEFEWQTPEALGIVTCISPWNFPLAIFTGQIAAALAAGNTVLAKPAEQTPLIAAYAVRLLHQAGIPRAALQLLPGQGETVGNALIHDLRVNGVLFTGSTEVARLIYRTLAQRGGETTLIAETGGQNALIVDSSALPEQVVTDVITSAFDSAGQRCSALRVLYLQEETAAHLLDMLKGAMKELHVGNPAQLDTDIGPVIDRAAQTTLQEHIQLWRNKAKTFYQTPINASQAGFFVPPTLIEIQQLSDLTKEVFGPVLHVLRYRADELEQVIEAINQTGYGLTQGLHSRIDETIQKVAENIHAGNIYINRNIIGAVVGTQPFGGQGLSGTGPKAGGPNYLKRLIKKAYFKMPDIPTQPVPLPALDQLQSTQADDNTLQLAIQHVRSHTLLQWVIPLPGPTGENNTLRYMPRGTVACLSNQRDTLLQQMVAAFATQNRVIVPNHMEGSTLASQYADYVCVADNPLQADIQAVLIASDWSASLSEVMLTLAKFHQALIPCLLVNLASDCPLERLVTEKTITVNTTAAGGNASLMCLGA